MCDEQRHAYRVWQDVWRVEAFSDYDGYNVFLRGNGVELKVGFHNTYQLEYDQEHLKDSFLKKVAMLAKWVLAG